MQKRDKLILVLGVILILVVLFLLLFFSGFWNKITGEVTYTYGNNLLKNPSFESGTKEWQRLFSKTKFEAITGEGNKYAKITVGESSNKTCWPSLSTGSPEQCNAVIQNIGDKGANKTFIARAKFRALAGTKAKLILKAIPYEGVITREIETEGNGQWQIIETPILNTTDTHKILHVRIVSQSPDKVGTYTEWNDVEVVEITGQLEGEPAGEETSEGFVIGNETNVSFNFEAGRYYSVSLPILARNVSSKEIFADSSAGSSVYRWNLDEQKWQIAGNQEGIPGIIEGGWDSSFELNPGEGFLFKTPSNKAYNVVVYGNEILSPVEIQLKGQNSFVGFPKCNEYYNSSRLIREIQLKDNSCKAVMRINSTGVISEYWSNVEGYARQGAIKNDFAIDNDEGYFIECSQSTNVRFTPLCALEGQGQITNITNQTTPETNVTNQTTQANQSQTIVVRNIKKMSLYSGKEAFLISDENWKDILPLVSVSVWNGNETCQKGYGTSADCVYPVLIYHKEGSNFDADSIVRFIQGYNPGRLTIVGTTPSELDNVLKAAKSFGAGLTTSKIQRIATNAYIGYWENYSSVVYVEDNYEKALIASTYASLINAPLIIKGSALDVDSNIAGKKLICVGSVTRQCDESYNLEQLRKRYVNETNTDKLVLLNPNDLSIYISESLKPEKSSKSIAQIYGKTSLAAPFLASAKHEVILTTTSQNYTVIRGVVNQNVNELMPWIINNSNGDYRSYTYYDSGTKKNKTIMYTDYVSGFLTIIASNSSIPLAEDMNLTPTNARSLDLSEYADLSTDTYKRNNLPNMATGRIKGLTISDTSSYVARDLFYDILAEKNNVEFFGSDFTYFMNQAALWNGQFANAQYNSHCSLYTASTNYSNSGCQVLKTSGENLEVWPGLWKDRMLVIFQGHGGSSYAGIWADKIPDLDNSIVLTSACNTCAREYYRSFCDNAIRKGAMAYVGTVSYGWTGDMTTYFTLTLIYSNNMTRNGYRFSNELTPGQAFTQAYNYFVLYRMDTFLGDPTLDVNPNKIINGGLRWS